MSLHIFTKSKIKNFHHFWKPLHWNHLNFFRTSLLWIDVKMISVSGIALKFQKLCMKTTPCQTFLHIASSLNLNWTLGGHDQAEGQSKTPGRAGSMIPSLRKISGKISNHWDKGRGTKKYDDIKPFLRVKITTRVSKSEKAIEVYFWEKKYTMKKWGLIFLK
jgi:hypothetical protein